MSKENTTRTTVGGQAVPEGVMMRAAGVWSVAVRTPDGEIVTESRPVTSMTTKHRVLGLPVIRGALALGESMVVGITSIKLAMFYSTGNAHKQKDSVTRLQLAGAIGLAIGRVIVLFKVLPLLLASTLTSNKGFGFLFLEGGIRVCAFVIYLLVITALPQLQRLYQYHSAEHKAVHCYEKGLPLTPSNVQAQSRIHPRCGTAFWLWVMLVAIFVFALVGHPSMPVLLASRVLLLPVIAGITYELLLLAARHDNPILRAIVSPGLALQYLTTRPCDLEQCEVAIASLEAALAAKDGVFVTAPRLNAAAAPVTRPAFA